MDRRVGRNAAATFTDPDAPRGPGRVANTDDYELRRHQYLGLFAYLFGFTPTDVDALTTADFDALAAWADDHQQAQANSEPSGR